MEFPSSSRLCQYYAVCVAQSFTRAEQAYFELFQNRVSQPSLTRAVQEVEQDVGELCIVREPFRLTPRGHETFLFAKSFVESFLVSWNKLRGPGLVAHVGAPEYALREYLLILQQRMEEKHGVRVCFHAATEQEIVCGVMNGTLHLGVCALNRPLPVSIKSRPLVEVAPVLLLPTAKAYARIKSAADFFRQPVVSGRLICADETHSVRTVFDAGLATMKVTWPDRIIATTTALVTMMVPQYNCPGLSLDLDKLTSLSGVAPFTLPGFEPVRYGPVYCEPISDLQKKLLQEIDLIAREVQLVPAQAAVEMEKSRKRRSA